MLRMTCNTSLLILTMVCSTHVRRCVKQAAYHAVPELVTSNGYSKIKRGKNLKDCDILHMINKIRFAQSSKARRDRASQEVPTSLTTQRLR